MVYLLDILAFFFFFCKMYDTKDRKRRRWLRCDRDKRDQGEFNSCGLQWILWTECCLKDSRWLFTKDYMWRVAPNTKWESQIPNKSNLPNSYKPCWFRWDFTIESIFWGGWKWVILCFPVGQKFIRWLCPHFARNFFFVPSSSWRNTPSLCNSDELLSPRLFRTVAGTASRERHETPVQHSV